MGLYGRLMGKAVIPDEWEVSIKRTGEKAVLTYVERVRRPREQDKEHFKQVCRFTADIVRRALKYAFGAEASLVVEAKCGDDEAVYKVWVNGPLDLVTLIPASEFLMMSRMARVTLGDLMVLHLLHTVSNLYRGEKDGHGG